MMPVKRSECTSDMRTTASLAPTPMVWLGSERPCSWAGAAAWSGQFRWFDPDTSIVRHAPTGCSCSISLDAPCRKARRYPHTPPRSTDPSKGTRSSGRAPKPCSAAAACWRWSPLPVAAPSPARSSSGRTRRAIATWPPPPLPAALGRSGARRHRRCPRTRRRTYRRRCSRRRGSARRRRRSSRRCSRAARCCAAHHLHAWWLHAAHAHAHARQLHMRGSHSAAQARAGTGVSAGRDRR
jgi:hypothetical protein